MGGYISTYVAKSVIVLGPMATTTKAFDLGTDSRKTIDIAGSMLHIQLNLWCLVDLDLKQRHRRRLPANSPTVSARLSGRTHA